MSIISEFKFFAFTFFNILPFVITTFFLISSIISSTTSGFFVLVGIILSSIITILVSKTDFVLNGVYNSKVSTLYENLPQNIQNFVTGETLNSNKDKVIKSLKHCNVFTLGMSPISYLPLSTHIFWFIFGYFLYVLFINNILANNWFLLTSLSALLFFDAFYKRDACVGNFIFLPIFIGLLSGIAWAFFLPQKSHMVPSLSTQSQCSANKTRFNCKIKRF